MIISAKKCLLIFDIHQHIDWLGRVLELEADDCDKIILGGDYFDCFGGRPSKAIVAKYLVELKVKYGDKIVFLVGNHDVQYFDEIIAYKNSESPMTQYKCSGYEQGAFFGMSNFIGEKFISDCKLAVMCNDYLITHAGVVRDLYEGLVGEPSNRENINTFLEICDETWKRFPSNSPLYYAGYSRGGYGSVPGLLWCDWYDDFSDELYYPQIVGHTYNRRTRPHVDNFRCYNLDCGQTEYGILYENGKVEVKNLIVPKK